MIYSGCVSLEFDLERLKDAQGKLYSVFEKVPHECEYVCVNLTIIGKSYFRKGNVYGPMDHCYPDEGYAEITSAIDANQKDWQFLLSEKEKLEILDLIEQEVILNNQDDYGIDSYIL